MMHILKVSSKYQSTEIVFFTGFAVLSLIASYASIVTAISSSFFLGVLVLVAMAAFTVRKQVGLRFREIVNKTKQLSFIEMAFLCALLGIILLQVVKPIKTFDTALYHTQNIKWIQSYEVIPGLGNLHHRFAFNTLFFPISALFSFEIPFTFQGGVVLAYPLNSVAFIVLGATLYSDIKKAILIRNTSESIYLFTVGLLSFLFFTKHLNSPSPDVIVGLLVIVVLKLSRKHTNFHLPKNVLAIFICLIFLCITYKLSTLFLSFILLPFLLKKKWDFWLLSIILIGFVVAPYVIRNYYLSGYLVFPFAAVDVFLVDWKLPLEKAVLESSWITSWARIPDTPYTEVLAMKPWEWIPVWFMDLKIIEKIVVLSQFLLIVTSIKDLKKRDYGGFYSSTIILVSLAFWFVKAPDIRFAYGFLIVGTAISFSRAKWFSAGAAYIVEKLSVLRTPPFQKYTGMVVLVVLGVFISLKITDYGLVPAAMPNVESKEISTNFTYYVPTTSAKCYNNDLPCTPYPKENIVLRGEDFQEGFKLLKIK
jgi:hypothetical protein